MNHARFLLKLPFNRIFGQLIREPTFTVGGYTHRVYPIPLADNLLMVNSFVWMSNQIFIKTCTWKTTCALIPGEKCKCHTPINIEGLTASH